MSQLPDWAELVSDFVETFGSDVRVTNLRLAAAPGYQLGLSVAEQVARSGGYVEAYEHNQAGFGPEMEEIPPPLPTGWMKERKRAPRRTSSNTLVEETNTGI